MSTTRQIHFVTIQPVQMPFGGNCHAHRSAASMFIIAKHFLVAVKRRWSEIRDRLKQKLSVVTGLSQFYSFHVFFCTFQPFTRIYCKR